MRKTSLLILALFLTGCANTNNTVIETLVAPEVEGAEVIAPISVADTRMPVAIRLLDYTPLEVYGWLGTPSLVRRDGKIQLAQFSNTHCVLDVYFYRPSMQMDFLANHVDARTPNGADFSDDECLLTFFDNNNYPPELFPVTENYDATLE